MNLQEIHQFVRVPPDVFQVVVDAFEVRRLAREDGTLVVDRRTRARLGLVTPEGRCWLHPELMTYDRPA